MKGAYGATRQRHPRGMNSVALEAAVEQDALEVVVHGVTIPTNAQAKAPIPPKKKAAKNVVLAALVRSMVMVMACSPLRNRWPHSRRTE